MKEFPSDPDQLLYLDEVENPERFRNQRELWEEALLYVNRFHTIPMVHPTDLYIHVNRTRSLAIQLGSFLNHIEPEMNVNYPRIQNLALHHDDPEFGTGDIPKPVKQKMNPSEKEALKEKEHRIAVFLSDRLLPEPYKDIYLSWYEENEAKQKVESQLVDIADKWDGLGETLHEIRCGNEAFFEPLRNYREIFSDLKKYPVWEKVAPYYGLDRFPTDTEAHEMSKLSAELTKKGGDVFWGKVFDTNLPALLYPWMNASLYQNLITATVMFTGWSEEVGELGQYRSFYPFRK